MSSPALPLISRPASRTFPPTPTIRRWREPEPSGLVMWIMGFVSRWILLRGWFRVAHVRVPAADRQRLATLVNRDTVAFLGPNHPEFGADWMVDKELSTMVAPAMASWADRGIVALAPRFWGMNNLVANDGGDAAKAYSVRVALRGDGVLLHPEGSVRWTNDHVNPLYPGIAQMALDAARNTRRPTYIVPLVWKYRFVADASDRLLREMRLIERALDLPHSDSDDVAERFATLQYNILIARSARFGITLSGEGDFFTQQSAMQEELVARLERRWPVGNDCSAEKRMSRINRAIRQALDGLRGKDDTAAQRARRRLREELAMAEEAARLGEFCRAVYGGEILTQEQVSESLKRIRDRLMREGWRNVIARMFPRPLGARVAHVGIPEGLLVDGGKTETELLAEARYRMQATLDRINARHPSMRVYTSRL